MANDPKAYLVVSVLLFAIGMAGFLIRKNLLIVFLSVELMLNAGALAILVFARLYGDTDGHVFFFLILALAAAESAVGLSMVIALYRLRHKLDTDDLVELRG